MLNDLVYVIPKENHTEDYLKNFLEKHAEIKFVSLVGIDLLGNDTDEKIPISLFLEDIDGFLKGAVQTDGSSVILPGIAELNNAKVDMVADNDVNWFIDYNYEHIDEETSKPIGTLRIPCFLYHENIPVDSRSILHNCVKYFKETLLDLFKQHPESLKSFDFKYDDIEDISLTSATELEFWVKTPNDKADVEELSTSQVLQEQYWKRTKGSVRSALEESLLLMEAYGLSPEMGHKEVGGVKAKISESGKLTHIMEQLEIDWKYADALQAADNELLVRTMIKEVFRLYGLDVTFLAKPIEGVAGSGEHTHIGVAAKLKSGKRVNLFSTSKEHFMSSIGYGSVMGVLKNYEVINPFVSFTIDSLRRLKPGFEAPICIVTSLGHSVSCPSRNRTVLLGLVRDVNNSMATRFELRAPNPHSNTYLVLSSIYLGALDGISYVINNNKSEDALLKELSKKPDDSADYLSYGRAYRSEENVFEFYTDKERETFFGKAPETVFENLEGFTNYPEKLEALKKGNVFTDKILESFKIGALRKWETEINSRIIGEYMDEIRAMKKLHDTEHALDLDVANWFKINELRFYLMKDAYDKKSLFTKIKEASDNKDFTEVSNLQVELDKNMSKLRELYSIYIKNLIDI